MSSPHPLAPLRPVFSWFIRICFATGTILTLYYLGTFLLERLR